MVALAHALVIVPFCVLLPLQTDLVSMDILDDVVAQVSAINAVAEVRCTRRSTVDLTWVLDTRCFSRELALAAEPGLATARPSLTTVEDNGGTASVESEHASGIAATSGVENGRMIGGAHVEGGHNHSSDGEHCAQCAEALEEGSGGRACSVHDPDVTTFAVDLPGSLELSRLERWLGGLLWDPPAGGTEIYRVKGMVSVEGRDERFLVQGVADLFEVAPAAVSGSAWREGEARRCKVVFIGRLLSKQDLERGLQSCMTRE